MNVSTENIRLWMNQSEPDYYMFFLKVWIPFNAWYVAEYPLLNRKDSDIIKELQDNINSKPKRIIKNFLDGKKAHDAIKFKGYLAELHFQLEKIPLSHNGIRLSFRSLALTENPDKFQHFIDELGNVYKAERTTSYFQAYIQEKGGKVLLDFKNPYYDTEILMKDTEYIRLDKKIQTKIFNLFESINPKKPISIIHESVKGKNFISIKSRNSCKIISDTETVAKACIKVLYILRCMLFHGEVAPTEVNKLVYKNAYSLLQLLINELK